MEPTPYVTLMHNPGAGEEDTSREELLAALRDAGYEPRYQSTKEDDFEDALADPGELVVVAGGDGTVGKVARRLSGRGIPIAVLPLGTANNIARTLGVAGWKPGDLIKAWTHAECRPFDVGVARGPWGERRFIEAAGVGLAPYLMSVFEAVEDQHESEYESTDEQLYGAFRTLKGLLQDYHAHHWDVVLDGQNFSGAYLMVEAMNIHSIGPNLALAPEADSGDGQFDVVLVSEAERDKLKAYVDQRLNGGAGEAGLTTLRGRHLTLSWDGAHLHVDDKLWPKRKNHSTTEDLPSPSKPATIEISLEPHALQFLVPRPTRKSA